VRRLAALALLLALLGAWEAYAALGGVDAFILPAPHEVAAALWNDWSVLAPDLRTTAGEVLLGVVLATVLGMACAATVHLSPVLRAAVYPLLVASQTIPIVIVAPLLVAWLGFGLAPKLVIVALVCFFPVTVTALDGLASTDPALGKLMKTFGASRWQTFRRVEAPAALPSLFSGARIAVAVAVIGAVLAEQAGSSAGLGHLILVAIPQLETARAYAAVVLLALLAVILFALLTALERLLVPWARTETQGAHP
jgi:NitT/TauT family transport system permease protein/putative hydroxymethylpyrimidine transport system permease protein